MWIRSPSQAAIERATTRSTGCPADRFTIRNRSPSGPVSLAVALPRGSRKAGCCVPQWWIRPSRIRASRCLSPCSRSGPCSRGVDPDDVLCAKRHHGLVELVGIVGHLQDVPVPAGLADGGHDGGVVVHRVLAGGRPGPRDPDDQRIRLPVLVRIRFWQIAGRRHEPSEAFPPRRPLCGLPLRDH